MRRGVLYCTPRQASVVRALCIVLLLISLPLRAVYAHSPSPNVNGMIGLNTVPTARMDISGTVRAGTGTLDPYLHGFLGVQFTDFLYVGLRQTGDSSSLFDDPKRLYPGLDIKLRLIEETRSRPEISLGIQAAAGHRRMAGEYLALSKRWHDFDFTAGLGWGRFGSAGHITNPLKSLSSHFGESRLNDSEEPNNISNWFTGRDIGFFGGVEYFTPLEGLSLKLDYSADRYSAEEQSSDFEPPPPWGLGLNWRALPGVDIALAMQGMDKIMGRLAFSGQLKDWPDSARHRDYRQKFRPFRTGLTLPAKMAQSAHKEDIRLYNPGAETKSSATASLALRPRISTPEQIGRAAVHMANHAGPETEALRITPTFMGLRGPDITLMRRDFERALAHHHGSAAEIWRGAEFSENPSLTLKRPSRQTPYYLGFRDLELTLENKFSLSEEENGLLYRTSLIAGSRTPILSGWLDSHYAVRLNVKDNLHRLRDFRALPVLPVRSDEDLFAARRISIDRAFLSFTHSLRTDLHTGLAAGFLEEMYAGLGGEVVYRPFTSRFALGAEAWQVFKRSPLADLNMGLNGDHLLTGHLNAWYDLPGHNLTLHAKAGRYLAEDLGVTLSAHKTFKNGAAVEGFITMTDAADLDLFGSITHQYSGVRLSMPLGGMNKYMPRGARATLDVVPIGRDAGQSLKAPLDLYKLTTPLSYAHIARHWEDILPEN